MSFLFAVALQMEPTAYYVLTPLQSLRHGLRRATSLYTREALVRQITVRQIQVYLPNSIIFKSIHEINMKCGLLREKKKDRSFDLSFYLR